MTALSNMPVITATPCDFHGVKKIWMKFDRTPQMSPYLVAFVVGELDYLQLKKKANKENCARAEKFSNVTHVAFDSNSAQ
ncbi:hypothetical protein NECAME_18431 [Necator americanus]|uniref:Uncharacterized protein n=1 Tax=Necator americanus TaxID=51031 RepID=W2SU22_NECAM|nr:hypothetical protein NECAME_18431 [Necator americanus]ETN73244.1 hypothetical protein NECAME_18431 [Necator americanus]